MNDYKVIIQNLARRPDRYHVAVGVLMGQGVPLTHVERFDAHDGSLYWNTGSIAHQASVNARILDRYGNGKYIEECYEGWDVYTYCYCWSWYEIVDSIARESDDNIPTLVLIDDWQLMLSHSQVIEQITKLYGMDEPFQHSPIRSLNRGVGTHTEPDPPTLDARSQYPARDYRNRRRRSLNITTRRPPHNPIRG